MILVMPLPTKLEDFPKPVDMSSQMSTPNNVEMEDASLEEIPTPSSLTVEALGPSSDALSPDVAHLWEEANKALGDLLVIKSSLDAHHQKLVLEFDMALHENDSEAMESIKEAKGICTHSIWESQDCCSVAIREAEVQRASQAVSIQQSHHKAAWCLEEESIEEERKSQLNFLSVCQAALQASPPKFHGMLVPSYHVYWDMHQCLISLAFPMELHPFHQGLPPGLHPLMHPNIHLGPSSSITLQTQWMPHLLVGPHLRQLLRGPLPQSGER